MKFCEVTGHAALKQQLAEMVLRGKISHAQLLLGREGCGNLAIALALAQFVNCTNRQDTDSCGECSSCKKASKYTHPDIHFTYPTVNIGNGGNITCIDFIKQWRLALQHNPYMNAQDWIEQMTSENKQGNITTDECARIIKLFDLKPYEGLYKILIIWLPEYLEKSGNKLLKLLEEPPENSLFILVANNEDAILNTILSRTQLLRIPPVYDADIIHLLNKGFDLKEEECITIAHMAEGNLREAMLLANHADNPVRDIWIKCLNAAATGHPQLMHEFVEMTSKLNREMLKAFFRYALQFIHECLMLSITGNTRLPEADVRMAQSLNNKLNFDQLEHIVQLLEASIYHIERNANTRIELMYTVRQMSLMFAGRQPADIEMSYK